MRQYQNRNKTSGKIRTRGIILTVILLLLTAAGVFLYRSAAEEDRTESTAQVQAQDTVIGQEEEEKEIPFVNIMDMESSELTISREGLTEEDVPETEALKAGIMTAVDAFSEEGYSTGFMLYDLNSGGGISYCADEFFYGASAIKGPYTAWLVQAYPETADIQYTIIENMLQWSSNEAYETLVSIYGYAQFKEWMQELGCGDVILSEEWYPAVSARDFSLLWQEIYYDFVSESISPEIRDLYTGTLQSAICETLGDEYTVYSKGGWIGEGFGTYYNVQNDAGIVMKGENPYVLVVLSDAYGRIDLLNNLVEALDEAHTVLFLYEK